MDIQNKTILVNFKLFDGISNSLQDGKAIVIEEGEITSVENHIGELPRTGYTILNLEGATLLPGLIDNHVHIALPFTHKSSNMILFEIRSQIRKNLRACINSGVTTVRDAGAIPGWLKYCRSIVNKKTTLGPRVLTTNSAITAKNGCPDWVPYLNLVEKMAAGGQYKESPRTPEEAKKLVEKMIREGADWIKIYYQSKSWLLQRDTLPVFDDDTFRMIMKTAKAYDKKVCCHVVWLEDLKVALSMGINSTEHSILDSEIPDATIGDFLKNDVALHPTLAYLDIMGNRKMKEVFHRIVQETGHEFLESVSLKQVKEFYKTYLTEKYPPSIAQCRKMAYDNIPLFEKGYPIAKKNALKLHKAGVKVGVASDSGGSSMSYFGLLYHEELKRMISAGFSNFEVLKAATYINAQILDMGHKIGSIGKGRIADFVVVEGNPFEDIEVMKNIRMVFKDGCLVKQQ